MGLGGSRAAALIALLLVGCTSWAHMPAGVIGPIDGTPSPESFERVLGAARTAGYEPQNVDAASGSFDVPSWTNRSGGQYAIGVRVYQEGWVQLVPKGPNVTRDEDRYRMPSPVKQDLVTLYLGMERAMEPGR